MKNRRVRYEVGIGDWIVSGCKTLLVIKSRLDGYVLTSDGLYWHPDNMRYATEKEILREKQRTGMVLYKSWLRDFISQGSKVGKIGKDVLLGKFLKGKLPIEVAIEQSKSGVK